MRLLRFQYPILSILYGFQTSATPPFDSWDISVDGAITVAPVEGSLDITLTLASYNISDRATEIRFMTPDCKIPLKHSFVGEPYIVNDIITDGFRQFDVQARLNGAELFIDGVDRDEIYDGDAIEGVVSFCVSNTNYMIEESVIVINAPDDQRENEVAVNTVDVVVSINTSDTGTFTLSNLGLLKNVQNEDISVEIEMGHMVTTYLCDPSEPLINLSNATEPIVYSQGTKLSICSAVLPGGTVRLDTVDQLTVSQIKSDQTEISFDYIGGDHGGNAQLTRVRTVSGVLVVTVQLIAAFFDEATPAPIHVMGELLIDYGTGWRRLAGPDEYVDEVAEPIDLVASIQSNVHGVANHHVTSAGKGADGSSSLVGWVTNQRVYSVSSASSRVLVFMVVFCTVTAIAFLM